MNDRFNSKEGKFGAVASVTKGVYAKFAHYDTLICGEGGLAAEIENGFGKGVPERIFGLIHEKP